MYKSMTALFIALFAMFLAGCSDQSVSEGKKQEEKDTEQQPVAEVEKAEEKEEISWGGQWVFLSDDNLGQLTIDQVDEETINYKLGGSRINPNNFSSYGNAFEGTGKITGNTIAFTDSLSSDCGGVMERKDSIITVTFENGGCHTPQVYLDGEYKKADAIESSPLFAMENGTFQIYGISIGSTPSTVKSLHGNPAYEGPDEEGFYEWKQDFEAKKLFVSYFENKADSIHTEAARSEFESAVAEAYTGDIYVSEEGAKYLYTPENEQLLIYNTSSEDSSKVTLFITYADGNFHFGVDEGWIKKE